MMRRSSSNYSNTANARVGDHEEYPDLPVPRRKTNTLSILRKLVSEYDGVPMEELDHQVNFHSDVKEYQQEPDEADIPDHCWVGEYLDDSGSSSKDNVPSYESSAVTTGYGRPLQHGPTSSNNMGSNSVATSSISQRSRPLGLDRHRGYLQMESYDLSEEEAAVPQRQNQYKELYTMLQSLEYKEELEELRREVRRRKIPSSARVFDYGHGERTAESDHYEYQRGAVLPRPDSRDSSDSSPTMHMTNKQSVKEPDGHSRRVESSYPQYDRRNPKEHVAHAEERPGMRKVKANVQPRWDQSMHEHGKMQEKKREERFIKSMRGKPSQEFMDDIWRSRQGEEFLTSGVKRRVQKTKLPYDGYQFQNIGDTQQLQSGRIDDSLESSYDQILSEPEEETKDDGSQSYEMFLDQLKVSQEYEQSTRRQHEEARPKAIHKGLPISVLTTGYRKREQSVPEGEVGPYPPDLSPGLQGVAESSEDVKLLKTKPVLKNIHRSSTKNEPSKYASRSPESQKEVSRFFLGSFNDTRKVLLDAHEDQANRHAKTLDLKIGSRLVIEANEPDMVCSSKRRSKDSPGEQKAAIVSRSNSSKPRHQLEFPLVPEKQGSQKSEESDDSDNGRFLHMRRPKLLQSNLEPYERRKMTSKPNPQKSHDDKFSMGSSDDRSYRTEFVTDSSYSEVLQSRKSSRNDLPRVAETRKPECPSPTRSATNKLKMPKHASPVSYRDSRQSQPSTSRASGKSMAELEGARLTLSAKMRRDARSKSRTYEGSDDSAPSNHQARLDGNFRLLPKQGKLHGHEYIDQFFERQIRLLTDPHSEVKAESRFVVKPHPKNKSIWEEEVDRYVNRPTGSKRRNSVELDKFDSIDTGVEAKMRQMSRSPPPQYKHSSHAHAIREKKKLMPMSLNEPWPRKSLSPSLKVNIRGTSHKAARDERRFEERSSNERDARKSVESMEVDRRSPKLSDIRRTIRRNHGPGKGINEETSSMLKQQSRKRSRLSRGDSASPLRSTQDFEMHRGDLETRRVVTQADEKKVSHSGNRLPHVSPEVSREKKRHLILRKKTTLRDLHADESSPNTAKHIVKRDLTSSDTFYASKSGANAPNVKRLKRNESRSTSHHSPDIVPLLELKIPEPKGFKENIREVLPNAKKRATASKHTAKGTLVKKTDQRSNSSTSKTPAITKPSTQRKKIIRRKESDSLQKLPVGTADPTKTSRKLASRESEEKNKKSDKMHLKRNAGAAKPVEEDVKEMPSSNSSASLCKDNTADTSDWLTNYRKWFTDVMQEILSKDELACKWGLNDPINFLKSVTLGNKRSMSFIPRGQRAKEMLRFIALNKQSTPNIEAEQDTDVLSDPPVLLKSKMLDVPAGAPIKDLASQPKAESFDKRRLTDKGSASISENKRDEEPQLEDSMPQNVQPHIIGEENSSGVEVEPINDEMDVISGTKGKSCDSEGMEKPFECSKVVNDNEVKSPCSSEESFIRAISEASTEKPINISVDVGTGTSQKLTKQLGTRKEPIPERSMIPATASPDNIVTKTSSDDSKAKSSTTSPATEVTNIPAASTSSPSNEVKLEPSKSIATSRSTRQRSGSSKQSNVPTKPRKHSAAKEKSEPTKSSEAEVTQKLHLTVKNGQGGKEKKSNYQQKPKVVQSKKLSGPDRKKSKDNTRNKSTRDSRKKSQDDGKVKSSSDDRPDRSGNRSQNAPRKASTMDLEIPSKEPPISSKQESLLPDFKKQVERTALRSLNILFDFGSFGKYKLVKAAKDALDSFSVINRGTFGFTVEHVLYYLSSLFKNPTADCLDDAHRQLRKSNLAKPCFIFDLEAFLTFQKTVIALCKENLNPAVRYTAQDQIKRRYVRQRAEYLFPQFDGETDVVAKLWVWSERLLNNLHKDSTFRSNTLSAQPFPEDNGESMEDRVGSWLDCVLHGNLHDESESYSCELAWVVKTQLMKRKSHATKQEAVSLLVRAWTRIYFLKIERRHRAKEVSEDAVESTGDPEELVVLDEVYSDESEEEKEELDVDLVEDSGSVQIDLF